MNKNCTFIRAVVSVLVCCLVCDTVSGAIASTKKHKTAARRRVKRSLSPPGLVRGGPWTEPTYADSSDGDRFDGEDLAIRRAAVAALGPYHGSVVIVEASNGRILSIVNQKEALGSAFQPCSTIKISVALAALREKLIEPQTRIRLGGRRMDLTYALAHSNNLFFAGLGQRLGFQTFSYYAHEFGYGEKSGLNIETESAGSFPSSPPSNGGVGMLTSFGEEISQTPLQLAALISAVANGGTLYYLQYPRTPQEVAAFTPRIKRELGIKSILSGITPGLLGAVQYGTARRARQEEPIAGKTGTCTEAHVHLGWFGSFSDIGGRKLAVVVLLTGGSPSIGARASAIAGNIYRELHRSNYSASRCCDRLSPH